MTASRLKAVADVIASARLAAWLIAALIAFSLLGFVIPQRSQLTAEQYADFERASPTLAAVFEAAGLDSLYASVPMLVIVALLAVNVTACTWRRIRRHGTPPRPSARFRPFAERALEAFALTSSHLPDVHVLDRARRELEASGWRCAVTEDALVGVKGRAGFWGSVVLHASLLVVVSGGVWSALSGFGGTLVLTEGQALVDEPSAYATVTRLPRVGPAYSGANVALESMSFGYEGDVLVSAVARMSARDSDGRTVRRDVRVNYPLDVGGKQYLLRDSGLAADITLAYGGRTERIVINLAEKTPLGWQDEVPLDEAGGRTLRLRVTPVPLADGASIPARDLLATDPRLTVQVAGPGASSSETAVLAPGRSATVAEATVTFHGAPVWSTFLVRGDPGRWLTYAGLWTCVVGIAWRFLSPERRVMVASRAYADGSRALAVGYRARPWIGVWFPGDATLVRGLLRPPSVVPDEGGGGS